VFCQLFNRHVSPPFYPYHILLLSQLFNLPIYLLLNR
jgi:hypothetical protein